MEAGHNQLVTEINDLGVRSLEAVQQLHGARVLDFVAGDGHKPGESILPVPL